MPSNSSGTSRPPICPPTPPRTWTPAPHRDLPPRGEKPKPDPRFKPPAPAPPEPNNEWDIFRSLIEKYTRLRRQALDTIRHYKSSTKAYDVAEVRAARRFLDTWRLEFEREVNEQLEGFLDKLKPAPGKKPDQPFIKPPGTPVQTHTFQRAVDAWRANNAHRLQTMSTAQLRVNYAASRVLRHVPDIMALQHILDIQDTTIALAMALGSLGILEHDLAQPGNDQIIDDLLAQPRLYDPVFDPVVLEELYQDAIDRGEYPHHPALIMPPLETNLYWTHRSADSIEDGVRDYLTSNRWNAFGSHFGALISAINEHAFPIILDDPEAIKEDLTPETAVFISLLRATIAPDHQDNEEDVIAWWEEMQLWIEQMDLKEIPPGIIREFAKLYDVALLEIAPQPDGSTAL